MSLWEVKVEMDPDQPDQIEEILADGGGAGWHLFQEPWVGQVSLGGYFETRESAVAAWESLAGALPVGAQRGEPVLRELEDSEWQDAYKHHFQASHFDRLHWVPVWERERFSVPAGEAVVWLDPGMAFGTGNHETTRLCMERILELRGEWGKGGHDLGEATLIDAGCGSGILAISAAKIGFGTVTGFDLDPIAVRVSEENAELNELAGTVEFYEGDVESGLAGREADVVVANILANVLCATSESLWRAVKPRGCLILSGILAHECDEVRHCFAGVAPEARVESRKLGEWAELCFWRP